MSLGNADNKDGTNDNPELRMPYRKRKRFHDSPAATQPQEKWRKAFYRAYPNLDSLSEAQKEAIESRFKVEYYIALGLDSSLPRTITSGSIETPRVSLLHRPPRIPSRASTVPAAPVRPIEPMGTLSPLTLQQSLPLQAQLSSVLPVPPLASLSPPSPHSRLSPLPLGLLQPFVPRDPYLSPFDLPYEKPLITSGPIKPLRETFVKSEEKSFLKPESNPYLRKELSKPLDDCFIKPIHPVSKPCKGPCLDPPKETSSTRFSETSVGDQFFKSTASSSSYLEDAGAPFKKPKRRETFFEPAVDPFKRVTTTQPDRGPFRYYSETTVKRTSDTPDTYIKPYPFFEPIKESPGYRDSYIPTQDPFTTRLDPLDSFYSPSTSALSVPKFGQSSSIYVDYPSIYPSVQYIDLREEIADNNNDNTVNNNNNENNDEPIDYSLNHPSHFQP